MKQNTMDILNDIRSYFDDAVGDIAAIYADLGRIEDSEYYWIVGDQYNPDKEIEVHIRINEAGSLELEYTEDCYYSLTMESLLRFLFIQSFL